MTPALATAVQRALRAPSVHNTQPWRWGITAAAVQLHADPGRHLVATDPDRRDLVISCGAALHHLQVALAATGAGTSVVRLPDPDDRDHLATVTIDQGPADTAAARLSTAIERRRTDRRRMSHTALGAGQIRTLIDAADRAGARLVPIGSPAARELLTSAMLDAAGRQAFVPGYAAELRIWTGRYRGSGDGVPRENVAPPPVGLVEPAPLRHFPHGVLAQPRDPSGPRAPDDTAALFAVTTPGDDVLDHLRAGEALSAVLLTATGLGLATTPLSQAMEVRETRELIGRAVLHAPDHPQILLRIGRPAAHAADLPETPRRSLSSVLMSS
jgi:nitroreductase